MPSRCLKILLTGLPGCGKTTAITKIIGGLALENVAGFCTQEIRKGGVRRGFRWKRFDGATGMLAHVDTKSRFRVGRYGVDVAGFENNVVPVLDAGRTDTELFVLDEIGKMECFSERFVSAARRLFKSDKSVLATVAKKGSGFISEVKGYPATELITLTCDNRNGVVTDVVERLSFLGK